MKRILLLFSIVALLPTMLSATVKHPVPEPTATPVVGETYYLYNAKNNAFLMPGENWHTRVGTSYIVGWGFKWVASPENGYFNLQSIKNGNPVYLDCPSQWETWYDQAKESESNRFQIEPIDESLAYYFHLQKEPTQYAFYRASGWNDRAIQSWIGSGNEDCQWMFISEVDYQAYMKAMDAYASAYTANMDGCITHYGNMNTLKAQSEVYDFTNGYMCNGKTTQETINDQKVLRVMSLWNDCHIYEEFMIMPAGDFTFSVEATKIDGFPASGPWVNTFAVANPSANWKAEPGATGHLGKANNFGDVNFTYDPKDGPLGVGLRTWGLNDDTKKVWGVDLRKFHMKWKGTGKYTVTVGETCYATLFLPYAVTIPGNIAAYTGELKDGKLHLKALEGVIPAETAVVLKATQAGDYTFEKTTANAFEGKNDLLGDINKTKTDAGNTYYALAKLESGVGFCKVGTAAIPGFKAYLKMSGPVSMRAITFTEDDDATAIDKVNENGSKQNAKLYNLSGQRISKQGKGINIINGKKILY